MAGNTPTFGAANLQWVGLAPETAYGSPIATPTYFVPADTPTWKHTFQKIADNALRGSMAAEYGQQNGIRYDEVTFKTYGYIDSVYYLVRSVLGVADVVLTGSSAPYTHKTSLLNSNNGQPQSTTVFWYDAQGKAWQMPGAQISTVKFTVKDAANVEVDVTFIGLPATAITAPTNTPTTQPAMPSWNSTITVAGSQLNQFSEIDVEIKRATEMIPTIQGSQSPLAIFAGPVSVAGNLTAVYQGSTDPLLADEIANTQPVVTLHIAAAGDAVNGLTLQMSKCAFDNADPAGTNKWMEIKSAFKGLANASDVAAGGGVSPVLATLTSSVSTAI